MKVLRGALVGCGFFGQIQLEAWKRMPEAEIVAACDVSMDRAKASAPHAYTSMDELLERETLDFVDIATRPDTHLPLVRLAVERRVPAICQKPAAPTLQEAVEMAHIADVSGVRVMIHENWRWQPWYREAKRRIDAGEIGEPVTYFFRHRQRDGLGPEPFPNQPYFREMPRLLMFETLVHYMDTARYLFGEIDSVFARTRRYNPVIRGEDGATVVLNHRDMSGVISGNRYLPPERPGSAMGEALLEGDESWIRIEANGDLSLGGKLVWQAPPEVGYKGDSVLATQRHFVNCLRSGTSFETGIAAYLPVFASVDAAYRSAELGRVVTLEEMLG